MEPRNPEYGTEYGENAWYIIKDNDWMIHY